MKRQYARVMAAAGLGLSLSGCIAAAAAIPVLAGSGVVGSRIVDGDGADTDAASIPRPPFDSAPASVPAPQPAADAPPVAGVDAPAQKTGLTEAPISAPGLAEASSSSPPAAPASDLSVGALPPVAMTLPDGTRIEVSGTDATGMAEGAATASTAAPIASVPGTAPGPYRALQQYALAKAPRPASRAPRNSVLLTAPGALQPDTQPCSVSQPAVIVDLDPADELLDPLARVAPNPALAATLARLRDENVSVHWLSGNSAAFAGAIRARLAEAQLDPDGTDELVLMRYPDDRKQARRRAVGATHCLIAIAGDERRDFDELYAFLKNPAEAVALEPMIGNGWFLVPPALTPASNSKDD